jgi:inorganic pyrophosphatase
VKVLGWGDAAEARKVITEAIERENQIGKRSVDRRQ